MATLHVSPSKIRPNAVHAVTFIGSGTSWLSDAPTFTPTGVSGISVGAVTVLSDTVATAPVTYDTATGTATWEDSTTSETVNQLVGTIPKWAPRRRNA